MVKIKKGKIIPSKKVIRRLSDMKDFFYDKECVKKLLKKNPVIYEVYVVEKPGLSFATTIIKPGKIGNELCMTKGHYHNNKKADEIYLGLKGKGVILMQKGNKCTKEKISKDVIVYIPPGFAHRTVNTGRTDLIFLSIYPSNAGHDYGKIRKKGFLKRILKK